MENTEIKRLLELAAKAAGIEGDWDCTAQAFYIAQRLRGSEDERHTAREKLDLAHGRIWWDPLSDDGDALRLAARLKIDVLHQWESVIAQYDCVNYSKESITSEGVRLAATRCAITRVAAAIGAAMP